MFESISQKLLALGRRIYTKKITEANIDPALKELRTALLEADVAYPVVKGFLDDVKGAVLGQEKLDGVTTGEQFLAAVYYKLIDIMGPVDPTIAVAPASPTIVLMAGLQGSGKTTTCGKLARHLAEKEGRRPLLVAADVRRPAAIDQLQVIGDTLGYPVYREDGGAPAAICSHAIEKARETGRDVVILDTAGRLHIDEEMMREVRDIARAARPHEILLVCDAMTGQDAVRSAAAFNRDLELTGVILTKLDGDARGGAALSVKAVTGKPIKFAGVGEHFDRIEPFRPERMASRIMGMGDMQTLAEKVQEQFDAKKQQDMLENLVQGTFDLTHFLKQLRAVRKMGTLREILSFIPGFGSKLDELNLDEKELVATEAIIHSMTPTERERPEILNTSRRERIARGSGRSLEEVNEMLKQFRGLKKLMAELGTHKGPLGRIKDAKHLQKTLREKLPSLMHQMAGGAVPAKGKGPAPPKPIDREELKRKRKEERKRRKKGRRK